jgi:hypothetical protein
MRIYAVRPFHNAFECQDHSISELMDGKTGIPHCGRSKSERKFHAPAEIICPQMLPGITKVNAATKAKVAPAADRRHINQSIMIDLYSIRQ